MLTFSRTAIQVNFLSTALLSLLLLPALRSSPGVLEPPTLTFVTTFSIYPASPFMLSTPSARTPVTDAPYISALSKNSELMQPNQYGRSKGLLLYFTRELAARARASPKFGHVTINSADPGAAWTGLTEMNRTKALPNLIMSWSARDVESGAKTLTNGVCAGPESHGGVLVDYDLEPYPGFMERESGVRRQKRVWEETRWALERDLPSLRGVFEGLPNPAR
jgi:NAD(P)-dependent dehydrogenase (short-subunit alcohol dehydrogenase family)